MKILSKINFLTTFFFYKFFIKKYFSCFFLSSNLQIFDVQGKDRGSEEGKDGERGKVENEIKG